MRRAALLLTAACAACHAGLAPEPPDELTGATFTLGVGSALRWVTRGSVGEVKADVVFDAASTWARVSPACFARGEAPSSQGFVSLKMAGGLMATYPEVLLHGVHLANLRMGSFKAALDVSLSRCEVVLGTDFLVRYALAVDPATRQLRLEAPRDAQAYQAAPAAGEAPLESYVLSLAKDPSTDWPLVTGRLRQGKAELVGPFLLATSSAHSRVSTAAAKAAGLVPGPDLLAEYGLSGPADTKDTRPTAFPLDALELTPELGVRWINVEAVPTWSTPGAVGMLGSDVWGRFRMTLDIAAGVLRLSRPRVLTSGDRSRCAVGPGYTEEGCFALQVVPTPRGPWVTGAVWRALPEGGRLYLESLGADGKPLLASRCRAGLSFDRSDRGVSTSHVFPWTGVASTMPECAEELRKVSSFGLGLFEEGDLPACPGQCAFVEDLAGDPGMAHGRVSCECQPQIWGTGSDSERKFLRLYREALERMRERPPALPMPEPEPAAPP